MGSGTRGAGQPLPQPRSQEKAPEEDAPPRPGGDLGTALRSQAPRPQQAHRATSPQLTPEAGGKACCPKAGGSFLGSEGSPCGAGSSPLAEVGGPDPSRSFPPGGAPPAVWSWGAVLPGDSPAKAASGAPAAGPCGHPPWPPGPAPGGGWLGAGLWGRATSWTPGSGSDSRRQGTEGAAHRGSGPLDMGTFSFFFFSFFLLL